MKLLGDVATIYNSGSPGSLPLIQSRRMGEDNHIDDSFITNEESRITNGELIRPILL